MNLYVNDQIDSDKYFVATYILTSTKNLATAAWDLAIGQSVGNPNVRSIWETEELFKNHSCMILHKEEDLKKEKHGIVKIAFPIININWEEDGVSQLLCHLMGGQMDIDHITECRLIDVNFPNSIVLNKFKGNNYGLYGLRGLTNRFNKPLFGGIVKPKTGISKTVLLGMVKELVEGGVDFIKEDEILSNPAFCTIEERVPLIANYINSIDRHVIYCVSINADSPYVLDRVKRIYELGGNGVHVNFWSGFGVYKAIRDLDLPIFLHFQKSGDKVITNSSNPYQIHWDVICKLAGLSGVDSIHAGMYGGYMNQDLDALKKTLNILSNENVVPALSCGMHPGLIDTINNTIGVDYMANVGGALHGHPNGTLAGAKAMRQAIDKTYGPEYEVAISKWGKLC